jgi:hypothetical protein
VPGKGVTLSGSRWFSWLAPSGELPANLAYDLRIWRKGELPSTAQGVDKPTRKVKLYVDLQFVPAIRYHGQGDYYWSVLVVECEPGCSAAGQVVGKLGEWRRFTYKP